MTLEALLAKARALKILEQQATNIESPWKGTMHHYTLEVRYGLVPGLLLPIVALATTRFEPSHPTPVTRSGSRTKLILRELCKIVTFRLETQYSLDNQSEKSCQRHITRPR